MAKILKSYGLDVTMLSSIHYRPEPNRRPVGRFRGIKYFMPSVHPETTSKLKRIYFKLVYIAKVLVFLLNTRRKTSRIYYLFDDNSVPLFPFLFFLERMGVIKLIFNLEEWPLAHEMRYGARMRTHFFVVLALKFSRKIVCVSSFLVARALEYNRRAQIFKLPALAEFKPVACEPTDVDGSDTTRFLYCGNVGYAEVIDIIIQAYESVCRSGKQAKIDLVLIVHGNATQMRLIEGLVARSARSIRLMTALSEADLFAEYARASVLLAPLRHTVQDQARFPQKVAEYVALARPVITTFVGDNCIYFEPDKSAIFLNEFSVEELAGKMQFAIDNKELIAEVGRQGNAVGRKNFDYRGYIATFGDFVTS